MADWLLGRSETTLKSSVYLITHVCAVPRCIYSGGRCMFNLNVKSKICFNFERSRCCTLWDVCEIFQWFESQLYAYVQSHCNNFMSRLHGRGKAVKNSRDHRHARALHDVPSYYYYYYHYHHHHHRRHHMYFTVTRTGTKAHWTGHHKTTKQLISKTASSFRRY